MKQIGARQEAGRIGGTGPCGRELCCSLWMTNFQSVGTGAARLQNLSLNPQKLAGQCAKLKCCLNYEIPVYEEATAKLPARNINLETKEGTYYFFAANPLKEEVTYSTAPRQAANLQVLTAQQANAIIEKNSRGEKPLTLGGKSTTDAEAAEIGYANNVVGQDDFARFDKKKKNNNHSNHTQARHEQKNNPRTATHPNNRPNRLPKQQRAE